MDGKEINMTEILKVNIDMVPFEEFEIKVFNKCSDLGSFHHSAVESGIFCIKEQMEDFRKSEAHESIRILQTEQIVSTTSEGIDEDVPEVGFDIVHYLMEKHYIPDDLSNYLILLISKHPINFNTQ